MLRPVFPDHLITFTDCVKDVRCPALPARAATRSTDALDARSAVASPCPMRLSAALRRAQQPRRLALRRARLCSAPSRPDIRGLMAGLTHADEGLTFDAAYDLLGGLDPADLHEWEDELFAKTGQRLRFATRDVSVVDTPEDGVCYRSLHFNDRFDVVQTCVALDAATGGPDHSRPPSLDSQAGTATQGLSLAVALHDLSSSRGDRNPNPSPNPKPKPKPKPNPHPHPNANLNPNPRRGKRLAPRGERRQARAAHRGARRRRVRAARVPARGAAGRDD